METQVISTRSVFKSFGNTIAADNISLQVQKGEIYGFLGLNGAGKTTVIRMLLGMMHPAKGSIHIFNQPLTRGFKLWNDVGYMVETPYAYQNLTVSENLQVFYKLRKLKQKNLIPEIIDKLKLAEYQDIKAKLLSMGNQQRLGIAKALLHHPKLLILDEPINGLDPEGIVEVRELLRSLAAAGSTIFLSSHILAEISKVADRIGIIHKGRMIRELRADELREELIKKFIVSTGNNYAAVNVLNNAHYHASLTMDHKIELSGIETKDEVEKISVMLVENGMPPIEIYTTTEDLEMYFLRTIKT